MHDRHGGELVAASGLQLTGEGGLLQQLTKRVLESALEGELTDHLGHEHGERAEGGRENYRNGHRAKTGEIDGLDLTLTFLRSKREQARRFGRTGPVPLGLPTVPHQNPQLTEG
ncbi:transposase [Streptomyces sp. NPDC050392]|uniref:transposase n=1 Tax=Streptomyces sp. NPDC050392 TaxID=3155782 RepID=UPI00342D5C60